MSTTSIAATKRTPHQPTARALRRAGWVPGVYYNSKREVRYMQFEHIALSRLLKKSFGLLELDFEGEKLPCVIREIQRHPVRGDIVHLDLYGVQQDQTLKVRVPLVFTGIPEGVKSDGGTLDILVHEIEVECLPAYLPSRLEVEVSALHLNEGLHLSDLKFENLTLSGDPSTAVVHVVPPRIHDIPTPEGAEAGAEAVPEPEVITAKKEEAEE